MTTATKTRTKQETATTTTTTGRIGPLRFTQLPTVAYYSEQSKAYYQGRDAEGNLAEPNVLATQMTLEADLAVEVHPFPHFVIRSLKTLDLNDQEATFSVVHADGVPFLSGRLWFFHQDLQHVPGDKLALHRTAVLGLRPEPDGNQIYSFGFFRLFDSYGGGYPELDVRTTDFQYFTSPLWRNGLEGCDLDRIRARDYHLEIGSPAALI